MTRVICYSFYPPRSDALFSNDFEDLFINTMSTIEISYLLCFLPTLKKIRVLRRHDTRQKNDFHVYTVQSEVGIRQKRPYRVAVEAKPEVEIWRRPKKSTF